MAALCHFPDLVCGGFAAPRPRDLPGGCDRAKKPILK
jgi:hypothetical protein